jgi:hypothetical protein
VSSGTNLNTLFPPIAKEVAVLDGLINKIPFLSAYSCMAFSSALVAGPITIFIPFAAKCLSFSKLTDGFVCVSPITSSISMLE